MADVPVFHPGMVSRAKCFMSYTVMPFYCLVMGRGFKSRSNFEQFGKVLLLIHSYSFIEINRNDRTHLRYIIRIRSN